MKKILNILQEIRSDIDFKNEKKLIDGGFLDSFDIIQIVSTFNDEFDIEIDVDELMPENFNSVEAMQQLIERLQDEA